MDLDVGEWGSTLIPSPTSHHEDFVNPTTYQESDQMESEPKEKVLGGMVDWCSRILTPGAQEFSFKNSYADIHKYEALGICSLGSVLNLINIFVLTRKEMNSSPINRILTGKAAVSSFFETTRSFLTIQVLHALWLIKCKVYAWALLSVQST